jgi:hypothetical protein
MFLGMSLSPAKTYIYAHGIIKTTLLIHTSIRFRRFAIVKFIS